MAESGITGFGLRGVMEFFQYTRSAMYFYEKCNELFLSKVSIHRTIFAKLRSILTLARIFDPITC